MSGRDQCQLLVDATLPFAEDMLAKHGEFFPFGANILASGEIVPVASVTDSEQPPSQELIDWLEEHFRGAAARKEIVASAILYDIRLSPPGEPTSDAVVVALEHRDGYCGNVYFPYSLGDQGLEMGMPFANKAEPRIF